MHDLNVEIIEERVDRAQKQLILSSRKRTIHIEGDDKKPVEYSHVKVSTVRCKDDGGNSYLIRIKAYRSGGSAKRKELEKAQSI